MDEKQKKVGILGLCGVAIVVAILLAMRGGGGSPELSKESNDKAKKLIDEMNANTPKPTEGEAPTEKGSGRKPVGGRNSK